jgi:SpoVK/Ycf46/Vps4 family AAA+-type ATPase
VRSLFSLANKLAPCVVCIDELDGLFRERSESEHEVSRDLKTEFLQWWDGMLSHTQQDHKPILVIGATNRPFDVDSAVLRRLPQSLFIGLPDLRARTSLMQQLLRHVPTDPKLDIHQLAALTDNYSPSDLRQLLQTAALSGPLREASYLKGTQSPPRPLTTQDVLQAVQLVPPTPMSAQYRASLANFARSPSSAPTYMDTNSQPEANWGNFYNAGTISLNHDSFNSFTDIVHDMDELSEDLEEDDFRDDEGEALSDEEFFDEDLD